MNELASLLPPGGIPRFACDAAWQSTLIGLVAVFLFRFRQLSPAARAWIALLAMILCIVAPCATLAARSRGAGWLLPQPPPTVQTQQALPPAIEQQQPAAPARSSDVEPGETETDSFPAGAPHRPRLSDPTALASSSLQFPRATRDLAGWIWSLWALAWAASSWALAARLAADLMAVRRLRAGVRPCRERTILAACAQAAQHVGLRAVPPVAYSLHVSCPTVLAWGSPCVLIPLATPLSLRRGTSRIDSAEYDRWLAVFCHELGHVRRRDGWSGLIAEATAVLLPWQPLIWLLRREFQRGCEEACDDWAVHGGIDPLDYAEALTEWIPRRSQTLALGIRSCRLPIRRRIERLLAAEKGPSPQLSVRWIVGGALLAAGAALVLSLLQTGMPRELVAADRISAVADRAAPHGGSQVATRWRPAALPAVIGDARLKHWSYVQALGFSADQESAFSAGRDGVVQIWNVTGGQSRRSFVRPHVAAATSGDGRRLFLAGDDGRIEIADSMTGRVEQTLGLNLPRAKSYAISLLAANRDGSIVAAGGRYSTATEQSEDFLAVWDAGSRTSLMTVVGRQPEWTPRARVAGWQCLALSADGTQLAAGGLRHIGCWNIRTNERSLALQGDGRIYALAFSPDGKKLASGDAAGSVKLWNTSNGAPVLRLENRATVSALAFSPSGQRLAVAAGNSVSLWNVPIGTRRWAYEPAENWRRTRPANGGLCFSGDGEKLSVGFANRLVLLDSEKGSELPLAGGAPASDITALSAAGSGTLLTGDAAGRLALLNASDGSPQRTWQAHAAQVDAIAVSRDHDTVASKASDGSLALWDAEKAEVQHTLSSSLLTGGGGDDMAFSADGRTLACLTRQQTVALWDVGSGRPREPLLWTPEAGVLQPVPSAGRFLLAQWQTGSQTALPPIGKADQTRHGFKLAISPDGRYAAGGVYGSRLEIWDLVARRKIEPAGGHAGRIQSLVFSADSSWLASSSEDGQVCFWRSATGERLATLAVGPPGGVVRKMAIGSDGRTLATLNGNGTVAIHQTPIERAALSE